jgi:uncharacterized protein YchJ
LFPSRYTAHVVVEEGGRLHETSRIERRAGRWAYVDGDVD